jgi:DNA-binding NtrC family response regulator
MLHDIEATKVIDNPGQQRAADEQTTSTENRPRRIHLLFVDDEECLVQLGEVLLTHLGYQVSAFTDSQQAYQAFVQAPHSFDSLLTDISMPVMKGTRLASLVRKIRTDLPVVLMTGFSDAHEMERARCLGFCSIIEKPFGRAKLDEALKQFFPRPSS